jgi:hypothetical protein
MTTLLHQFKWASGMALLAAISLTAPSSTQAQGCVAIRNMSSCSGSGPNSLLPPKSWQVSLAYRQFRSFRHFSGTEENKERLVIGNEVINKSKSLDIGLTYALSNRLSVSAILPVQHNDRSSWYEHDRVNRYHSQSQGIGDLRVTANYWLLDPQTHPTQNISLGLGLKAPTGNNNAQDEFHIKQGEQVVKQTRPVDQSIQLGDGGWAPTLEFQGFKGISHSVSVYAAGFYLLNPRDTTQTRTYRETLRSTLANESHLSVPDQFMARAGVAYNLMAVHGLSLAAGARIEGIPVHDLIGQENGFRRPGHVVSAEPTVSYMRGRHNLAVAVPIAVIRNRTQSVTDKAMNRHGDAAFADYLVSVNYAVRL